MSGPVPMGEGGWDGAPEDALAIARVLFRKDLFATTRSDTQLALLVERAVATVPQPYSMLLCRLLGYYPRLRETTSRDLWDHVVAHRVHLATRLGRPVHLRVAALDLIALGEVPDELGAPILLGRQVVRGILDGSSD